MSESLDGQDRVWLLFDLCREIEGAFAELYHFYSHHFRADTEIAHMWKKTAMEEENHQHQFALARRMMSNIACTANIDIETAVDVRDKIAKLVATVTKRPPDLATALQRAIDLEEKLALFHAGTVVSFTDTKIKNMFSAMLGFDQEHVDTLRRYYASVTRDTAEVSR